MQTTPHQTRSKRRFTAAGCLITASAVLALSGCAAVSQTPANKAVYDFGPVVASVTAIPNAPAFPSPLALADVGAVAALDSTAVQYRLAYANDQELRPYALSRWTMPPAQLIGQRVRGVLAARGPVLTPGMGSPTHIMKLELEEFSQIFDSPGTSQGVVRLRATLLKGTTLVAQRSFSAQVPAPTPDASGGVRALSVAADGLAKQLSDWVGDGMR